MPRIGDAPSGENTSLAGTEKVPVSGSQFTLVSTIAAYIRTLTQTLTNKTINLSSNTLTGTTAEFNTALSDGNFATLAGSETLTNKTITTPTISGAISFPDGVRQTFNPDGTNAGLNVGSQAGDPSAPSNGDLWYDSTANELTARINGSNVALGAGGGGSLTVKEEDGAPSVSNVTEIKVTNGTLTDNGSGSVSITTGGGGGGAPTNSTYVTTSADGTLSAEKVLPFLANYNPDKAPASPSGNDDEFDDDSIAGAWSQINTPDTISESTYHGYLYVKDNETQTAGVGVRKAYTPGANALTVVIKISATLTENFSSVWLVLEDSGPAALVTLGLQNASASLRTRNLTGVTESNTTINGPGNVTGWWYLMIQRDNSTNYTLKVSQDGITYYTVTTYNKAGTIANVSVLCDPQGAGGLDAAFALDFIRFFTSQTEVIGAAP